MAGAKHEINQKGNADAKDDYNSSNEDYSDDGDEDADSYKVGGYHPVEIGEIYNKRYQIVEKMGWGHFSTVWLCLDLQVQKEANRSKDKDKDNDKGSEVDAKRPLYVAMKIQKSASHYRDAAFDEIELLQSTVVATTKEEVVKEHGAGYNSRVVILLDDFEHKGPNGKHVCMVFEMLGENLLRVIKNFNYKGMNMEIVRNFTREICIGLDFLHRHCQIIHTDLKPENILVATPCEPKESSLKSLLEISSTMAGGGGGKTEKKSNQHKQAKKTNAVNASGSSGGGGEKENNNNGGNKPPTAEQKKKLKRKNKKKRQKAKRSEKNLPPLKGQGPSDDKDMDAQNNNNNLFVLSPADELKEMALMEKASLPVASMQGRGGGEAPTTSATSNAGAGAGAGVGSLEISTDKLDDTLDNSLDDWNLDDDVSTSSLDMTGSSYQVSLGSLSPPYKQSKRPSAFSQVVLRSRESQPWLKHTLLAAINCRSMQYTSEMMEDMQLDSPYGGGGEVPLSPPPSDYPQPSLPCPLGLSAIDSETFSYPPGNMWTVIHMVSGSMTEFRVSVLE